MLWDQMREQVKAGELDLDDVLYHVTGLFFFFFTLFTVPRRSLSLKLSDTRVYAPQIRARLGNHSTFL